MPNSKALDKWIAKHPGIVQDVDYGSGYCTGSGNAWNILLTTGHCAYGDSVHSIIEETVREAISELNNVQTCDCWECRDDRARGDQANAQV